MNKIDGIEAISDKLAETTIAVLPKRCSFIRNWNAKCRACLNMCGHDAIERSLGHLEVNSELCTNCAACVAACPTGALVTSAPTAGEIVREAKLSAKANDGHVVFACSVLADVEELDTGKVAVLPCLNYLDEYLVTGLYAFGVKSVNLLHGACGECSVDAAEEPIAHDVVKNVKKLLKLWDVDAHVRISGRVPKQVRPTRESTARGLISAAGRRDAFRQAGGSVMGFVAQTVSDAMDDFANEKKPAQPRKQITVRIDEVFPPETYRSVRLLKMLDRIGTRPRGRYVETPFWASVGIDPEKCRHCGMCSKMCVTRALKFIEDEQAKTSTLTFTPSLCIGCRMCKDTCFTHSMLYANKVLADDLDADVTKVLYEHQKEKRLGTNYFG